MTDIASIARDILKLFDADGTTSEPWARDEKAFEEHFGCDFEDFGRKMSLLSTDQVTKYEATLKVNPEAAVLWVVCMHED